MPRPDLELRLHRFLAGVRARLDRSRDADQALRAALRSTVEFFGATAGCLAELTPDDRVRVVFAKPERHAWDVDPLGRFLRNERPRIRPELTMAPIRRKERDWRVIGLHRERRDFGHEEREAFSRVARELTGLTARIDRERIAEVRARIDHKIMEELRPKDLAYQILHGLRTLTGYDHSSALLIGGESGETLEVVAEQIAWRKGKSERIGLRLVVGEELRKLLRGGEVYRFERRGRDWVGKRGDGAPDLAGLLDYNEGDPHRESAMLCAPLLARDGLVGVLKVAGRHRRNLGEYEARLVREFLPQVSVAIQNARRTQTLESRVLQAERKHAMADLARSVAHDLNNAMGAVLPLVQQMRSDLEEGRAEPEVLAGDLAQMERSLAVCRRIFGGMLAFARGATRSSGRGDLAAAVESALTILDEGMKRRRIERRVELEADLPPIRCSQNEIEQLVFNLLANARDAMPRGGTLTVDARHDDGRIELTIGDTGHGIPEENLALIREPFFTTKPQGNGLGLTICRAIVWEMRGRLEIESREREGTRIRVTLPTDQEDDAGRGGEDA